ncbi:MAG: GlcG/HbpS family heme-binding protein [Planctomycetota bacterium]|jgi:uncharacterized protein GlcG (DUF336 family)
MDIILQNAIKADFFVISGRNSGKIYEVLNTFYAKQTQFPKSQVNVNLYNTMDYENKSNWTLGENKPNSNPNKANLHFTAENTEYAEKKDISVSNCSIDKYALYEANFRKKETKMIMGMKQLWYVTVLVLMLGKTAPVAELATKKALTLEVTKRIAAASGQFAQKNRWNVVIAIVDDGGHLVYFERMDGVQTGSIEVAIRKAQAAAAFKRPTRVFEEAVAKGRTVLVSLPGGMPFEGGVPITVDGQVIGAVGVSGVTAQQDGMVAQAGVDALPKILGR